jgi:hypothetical protein
MAGVKIGGYGPMFGHLDKEGRMLVADPANTVETQVKGKRDGIPMKTFYTTGGERINFHTFEVEDILNKVLLYARKAMYNELGEEAAMKSTLFKCTAGFGRPTFAQAAARAGMEMAVTAVGGRWANSETFRLSYYGSGAKVTEEEIAPGVGEEHVDTMETFFPWPARMQVQNVESVEASASRQ